MSEGKKGLGMFITKTKAAAAGPAASGGAPGQPKKNVQKRWLYVGGGIVLAIVVSSSLFGNKPAPRAPVAKKDTGMVSVTPPNADREAFESRFAKEMEQNRRETETLKAQLELMKAREQSKTTPPPGIVAPPSAPGTNTGGLGAIGETPPAPPVPPTPAFRPPVQGAPNAGVPNAGALPPLPSTPMVSSAPLSFDAPVREKAAAEKSAADANAKARYTKNASAGVLPVGAFAPIALLNGVDAGTSSTTQNNPMPILMNITDQATLPGSAKYRLKSCFLLGTAYGDLSAERVYGRISRLSCVDKQDRLVLNSEVQGYIVDSDGKLGMRGLISDRQGQRLGKALLAGFANGLAGALGSSQGTVLSNLTTGTTTNSIDGTAALRASGLSGAQAATAQLAEFYLKEAQSIFPVISVDVGRTGTVVFTNPVKLDWSDGESQFVQQVTPTNN